MMFNPASILRLLLAPPLRLRIRPRYFAPVALDSPHQALHDDVLRLLITPVHLSILLIAVACETPNAETRSRMRKPNTESRSRMPKPRALLMSVQQDLGSLISHSASRPRAQILFLTLSTEAESPNVFFITLLAET